MDSLTKENLDDIIAKIKDGNVSLFLGAGTSSISGLPLGAELSQRLKDRFPKIDNGLNEFMEICDDVLETPPYNRNELVDFIRHQLSGYEVTDTHTALTKYDWSAIFTTNFDDIIEAAYTQSKVRKKSCYDIVGNTPSVSSFSDKNKLYLFKIMGTTRVLSGDGEMVLTTTDFLHSFEKRSAYYRLLKDFIKNGSVVFIGYSFKDKIIKQALDDILKISGGVEKLPYSYALFKDPIPDNDEKTKLFFSKRRVIPIHCDFENFIKYIEANYNVATSVNTDNNFFKVRIKNKELKILESDYINYSTNFEFLVDERIDYLNTDKDSFFKGDITKWNSYKNNWDFIRDCYQDNGQTQHHSDRLAISKVIDNELRKFESANNKILLIKGMPGSGKSVLLRRIAFDVYTKGEHPVIILNENLFNYDRKMITGFMEDIREKFVSQFGDEEQIPTLKFLIIVDDLTTKYRDIVLLKEFLTSRGRSVLFIVSGRTNEITNDIPIIYEQEFELPENLSENEIGRIAKHIHYLGLSSLSSERIAQIIRDDIEMSFFATMYTFIHPTQKPLNEIIKDQYESLSPLSKAAFEYICCFTQFNLSINVELLVRTLDVSYSAFVDEVVKSDAQKIIFEDLDTNGNHSFKAHHRIIARKTIEFFVSDTKILHNRYIEILKNANFSVDIEREVIEKLIIDFLKGRESLSRKDHAYFTNSQLKEIFETICKNNPTRSLLHHFALIEQEDKNFAKAEELLERALEISKEGEGFFSAESDQNIYTSIGSLNSKLGQEFLVNGDLQKAEVYFAKAEEYYGLAKHSSYSDGHAYHSHAYMYYKRGLEERDESKKLRHFAEALEITSAARDNISEDSLQAIYEIETRVYEAIDDTKKLDEIIEILRSNFDTPKGYFIVSSIHYNKGIKHKAEDKVEESKHCFKLADEKIKKGLKYYPNDSFCLALKCKINKERYPYDYEQIYGFLEQWKKHSTFPSAKLQYDYARIAFILGYYDISRSAFDELQGGVGLGNKDRSKSADTMIDLDTMQPIRFEGKIINIFNYYEGLINPYSLPDFKGKIPFSPIACKFKPVNGMPVKFGISFTFRGPIAENLSKI